MKKRFNLFFAAALALSTFAGAVSVGAQDAPTLVIWADETRAGVIEELGAGFEEEYGVTLEVQQLEFGDIRDQLRVQGPAGEGPDIIVGAHDWLGELVAGGLVAPIDLSGVEENFEPVAISALSYEGDTYGVPYAVENVALFYNTELVPEAPATWEEVRAISEEIVAGEGDTYGFVIQQGDPYHFFPVQTSFGGYVFGLDEEGSYNPEDVGIDSEGSVAALEFVTGMIEDGLIPAGLDGNTAQTLFQDGQAAMYITGPWNVEAFTTAGTPFAIAPIPAGTQPGAPFVGVQGFMVSAFSENQALAQAFLTEFIASEEVQAALFEAGGRPSAHVGVAATVEDPNIAAFGEAGAVGLAMPAIPEMASVWSFWGDSITLAMQGEQTPAEAFGAAAESVREAIAGE